MMHALLAWQPGIVRRVLAWAACIVVLALMVYAVFRGYLGADMQLLFAGLFNC
jgi:hypothetical protein